VPLLSNGATRLFLRRVHNHGNPGFGGSALRQGMLDFMRKLQPRT